MRKMMLGGMAATMLAGCSAVTAAPDQPAAAIRGNYKKLAACVYQALDPLSPGNFRLTDLGGSAVITFETSGGGMTFRDLKASFVRVSETTTTLEIEARPPGYYAEKVRPLADQCGR